MKDQRTSYGAEDKCSSAQQIRILDMNRHSFGPIRLALVGLTANWLADKMWVEVEFLKVPYRLNYSDFYYVCLILVQCYYSITNAFHSAFLE